MSSHALNYDKCVGPNSVHCYGQTIWDMSGYYDPNTGIPTPTPSVLVEGAEAYIYATPNELNVPGFANGYDRINDPLWVAFSTGGFPYYGLTASVEAGQYAGGDGNDTLPSPPASDCCTLHYYVVEQLPTSSFEADFPTGPPVGQLTEYATLDPNKDGTWCSYIAGSQVVCWNGTLPTYANNLQDGMEMHVYSGLTPTAATGDTIGFAQFLDNNWYAWQSNTFADSHGQFKLTPPDNGLCVNGTSSYGWGSMFYSTTPTPQGC